MKRLNLLLILVLSFFVLHLYLPDNDQQEILSRQIQKQPAPLSLSSSGQISLDNTLTFNNNRLNYKTGKYKITTDQKPSKHDFLNTYDFNFTYRDYNIIRHDQPEEHLYTSKSTPGIEQLDYQTSNTIIPEKIGGLKVSQIPTHIILFHICPKLDHREPTVLSGQQFLELTGHISDGYNKPGLVLIDQTELRAYIYKQ